MIPQLLKGNYANVRMKIGTSLFNHKDVRTGHLTFLFLVLDGDFSSLGPHYFSQTRESLDF